MKELASAFGSEVFRPLMTLIVPGCIAITPWTVLALAQWPDLKALAAGHYYEAIVIFLAVAISTGMLLEDWGSWLETMMDTWSDRQEPKGEQTRSWYRYLRLSFVTEPIGHRYLRTLVLRLKFELGTGVAFFLSAVGLWCLQRRVESFNSIFWPLSLLALAWYLIVVEAWSTQRRLGRLRTELLRGGCILWGERSIDDGGIRELLPRVR